MKLSPGIWPPAPARSEPLAEIAADTDDWLTANDLLREVIWRDYAIIALAVLWLLLACFAISFHHCLPAGAIKNIHYIVRTVLS